MTFISNGRSGATLPSASLSACPGMSEGGFTVEGKVLSGVVWRALALQLAQHTDSGQQPSEHLDSGDSVNPCAANLRPVQASHAAEPETTCVATALQPEQNTRSSSANSNVMMLCSSVLLLIERKSQPRKTINITIQKYGTNAVFLRPILQLVNVHRASPVYRV